MSNELFVVSKVNVWDMDGLNQVCNILFLCGKDMAKKFNLQHWNNSYFKDIVVVVLCVLKNDIYIVRSEDQVVATFQTHLYGDALGFQKLATSPQFSGKGIGSFCLRYIEDLAKRKGCQSVICDVYDKSQHAIDFYEYNGYVQYGTTDTLKYKEIKMRKDI